MTHDQDDDDRPQRPHVVYLPHPRQPGVLTLGRCSGCTWSVGYDAGRLHRQAVTAAEGHATDAQLRAAAGIPE